ncbi:MAG: hypothetical protein FJ087_21280 [Deltaproteobacteria bacterium]|nr:hypothetical protein [Deltaproteobacteria bacterium]
MVWRTKVVGRRSERGDPVEEARIWLRTVIDLRGTDLAPKGVHRFRTHEEAEAWMNRELAKARVRRRWKTSSGSADR